MVEFFLSRGCSSGSTGRFGMNDRIESDKQRRRRKNPIINRVDWQFHLSQLCDGEFRCHYRMSDQKFNFLLEICQDESVFFKQLNPRQIQPRKFLYGYTIWFPSQTYIHTSMVCRWFLCEYSVCILDSYKCIESASPWYMSEFRRSSIPKNYNYRSRGMTKKVFTILNVHLLPCPEANSASTFSLLMDSAFVLCVQASNRGVQTTNLHDYYQTIVPVRGSGFYTFVV